MAAESMRCSWCGAVVTDEDCWRAHETGGDGEAVFCRLEHVVPWAMKGPGWSAAVLVHHRGPHRVEDEFSSLEELRAWAAAGGPWR